MEITITCDLSEQGGPYDNIEYTIFFHEGGDTARSITLSRDDMFKLIDAITGVMKINRE